MKTHPNSRETRKKILLVDGNNMTYRSAWKLKEWPELAFLGVINEVFDYLQDDEHDYVVVCFDDRPPKFRLRLWPEYKGKRASQRSANREAERTYEIYKTSVAVLPGMLQRIGVDSAKCKGFEGDDVISAMTLRRFSDCAVTIMSEDLDFIQLCEDMRVKLYHPSKRKYEHECPDGWLYRKMLIGDASDNLPGLPGVGDVKAGKLIDSMPPFHSFDELVEHARVMGRAGNKIAENLYLNREMLKNQMRVIDLRRTARIANQRLVVTQGVFDEAAAREYPPLVAGQERHPSASLLALLALKRMFSRMKRITGNLEPEEDE